MDQDQVISGRTGSLSEKVMENIGTNMEQYGIELLSFETKQLDLPNDNKEAVYERMISERENIAATYTAEGNSEAKVIRNTTDKEVAIRRSWRPRARQSTCGFSQKPTAMRNGQNFTPLSAASMP